MTAAGRPGSGRRSERGDTHRPPAWAWDQHGDRAAHPALRRVRRRASRPLASAASPVAAVNDQEQRHGVAPAHIRPPHAAPLALELVASARAVRPSPASPRPAAHLAGEPPAPWPPPSGAGSRIPTPIGEQKVEVAAEFEVGRPPGLKPGTPIDVALAFNIGPIPVPPRGPLRLAMLDQRQDDRGLAGRLQHPTRARVHRVSVGEPVSP
jgi:hypothetical protein